MGSTTKLQISCYKDTDTHPIWNGQPAWSADDVAQNLNMDFDSSGSPVGLTLEHAAQLLLTILQADIQAKEAATKGSVKPARSSI